MTLNLDSIYLHEIKGNQFEIDQAVGWALLFLNNEYKEVSIIGPDKQYCNAKDYNIEISKLKSMVIQNA